MHDFAEVVPAAAPIVTCHEMGHAWTIEHVIRADASPLRVVDDSSRRDRAAYRVVNQCRRQKQPHHVRNLGVNQGK